MHDAEHSAVELAAIALEGDTMDGSNLVIVDRAERGNQRGHAIVLPVLSLRHGQRGWKRSTAAGQFGGQVQLADVVR